MMKKSKQYPLVIAAAKTGMSTKTAYKYLKAKAVPSELKKPRTYRTRQNPFAAHWTELEAMLHQAPELQAKTVLTYLMERYPGCYHEYHLRTLQRQIQTFRALYGRDKPVIFRQLIEPGESSQSDWTMMNELGITLSGQPFHHLLYHFMLPYSGWETFFICQNESFDSLITGYERAVWELGGTLPHHRTDNVSAATQRAGHQRVFTERWQAFLQHYGVQPTRNNPGQSHENGSVEKSHDLFKNAVRQHLLLRGSRNFANQQDYDVFLMQIKNRRNQSRHTKLQEELSHLQPLPERRWKDPVTMWVRVTPSSTVHLLGCVYSVPSRLISYSLRADIGAEQIELYYGQKLLLSLPRIQQGDHIDYRHIIDSLIRKPGAFLHYQYRECLFPRPLFRQAYDQLQQAYPRRGHKYYLQLLQLAKLYGEEQVETVLALCQKDYLLPEPEQVKKHLVTPPSVALMTMTIQVPPLASYDRLYQVGGLS